MAGESVVTMGKGEVVPKQSIYEQSSEQLHALGAKISLGDGRVFHYSQMGAVAVAAGALCQAAAPIAHHTNRLAAAAVVVGARRIQVAPGATGGAANLYAEGYLHCNDAAPAGLIYKVKSHLAITASTAFWVNLYDPVIEVLTTASEVTLAHNPYKGLLIAPNAALTAAPMGVPIIDVTAAYYAWLQTAGPCAVLTQGTVVIGQKVGLGGTADGAIGPVAADVTVTVGKVMRVNASTEYSLIYLTLSA